jgi:hypothetical protein
LKAGSLPAVPYVLPGKGWIPGNMATKAIGPFGENESMAKSLIKAQVFAA